jgi:hypothetical protein
MVFVRETEQCFVSVSLDHNDVAWSAFGGPGVLVIEARWRSNSHYVALRDDHVYRAQYTISIVSEVTGRILKIREKSADRVWIIDLDKETIERFIPKSDN